MKEVKYALLAGLTAWLISGQAVAGIAASDPFSLLETLEGAEGLVDVGEYECDGDFCAEPPGSENRVEGMYLVNVLDSNTFIDTLAVSTDGFAAPFTWLSFWEADYVSAADWDTNLGAFATLFGDAAGVHLYHTDSEAARITDGVNDVPGFPATVFEQFPDFGFEAEPSTEFAAFLDGALVDCSNSNCSDTAAETPAPGALLLLAAGLLGFAGARRHSS